MEFVAATVVTAAVGSFLHFAYELSGEVFVIGLVAPVNESVFEHLKLVWLPITLWTLGGLFILPASERATYLLAAMLAIFVAMCVVVIGYYSFHQLFGIESLAYDVSLYVVAMGIANALVIYAFGDLMPSVVLALLFFTAYMVLFPVLTVYPPHVEFFRDPARDKYGMDS